MDRIHKVPVLASFPDEAKYPEALDSDFMVYLGCFRDHDEHLLLKLKWRSPTPGFGFHDFIFDLGKICDPTEMSSKHVKVGGYHFKIVGFEEDRNVLLIQ